MLSNPQKNLIMFFIAALAVAAIFFFFPGVTFPQDSTCPAVPEGCFSPKETLKGNWEMGVVPVEEKYLLVLMRNKIPGEQVTHAMGIFLVGSDWPVLFNYVENGVVKFLRFDIKSQQYVWDETVDDENYAVVAKMYRTFMKVDIAPRKSA